MSRSVSSGNYLRNISIASGSSTWSVFMYVYSADLFPPSSAWLTHFIGTTDVCAIQYTSAPAVASQVDWGGYSTLSLSDPLNNAWWPIMITGDQTDYVLYFGDPDTNTPVTKNFGVTQTTVLDRVDLKHHNSSTTILIAESCLWDRVITQSEFDTLITPVSGSAPNPTTLHPTDIVAYTSFRADTLDSDYGTESITWDDNGVSSYSATHPSVDEVNQTLDADTQTYTLTGTELTLTYAQVGGNVDMPAETRDFPVIFYDATLSYSEDTSEYPDDWFNGIWWHAPWWGYEWWATPPQELPAEPASFTLTGTDVTLTYTEINPILEAEAGSYLFAATDADLLYSPTTTTDYEMDASTGVFSFVATDVNFVRSQWVNQSVVTGTWTTLY